MILNTRQVYIVKKDDCYKINKKRYPLGFTDSDQCLEYKKIYSPTQVQEINSIFI